MFVSRIVKAGSDLAACVVNLLDCYSPTATNAVVTGNDWFTLGYMSVVYALISEKEKNAKLQIAENK